MSRPVAIRKLVIEINMQNLEVLRDSLKNYHEYLKKCLEFDHKTILSRGTIKRRIAYIEDFLNNIELVDEGLQQ